MQIAKLVIAAQPMFPAVAQHEHAMNKGTIKGSK
jgi:hypothetical protein